ncbi:MAG: riboflavin synthase [Marinicellaceae bacterium]
MFTGLIQSVGCINSKRRKQGDLQFVIDTKFTDMSDVELGDSIAINGVCLTVTSIKGTQISVDVSSETIDKTEARFWQEGTQLNLEKSLTLKDKLGGHMVSGHVDAVAKCINLEKVGISSVYQFKIPSNLDRFVVKKGSLAINGVSLTVNEIQDCVVSVNLIPHTLEHTNLGLLKTGDQVNIEIDTIARYVEKMMNTQVHK